MARTTGTVKKIFVNPSLCCVTVKQTSGGDKVLLLWSYINQEDNATNRLTHGTYLALTRDAYLNGKTIEYSHASNSALVDSVAVQNP